VRSFCLADSHIFCAGKKQAIEEMGKALDLIEYISSVFGLKFGEDYWYRLSLGDRKDDKKFYKNDTAWDEGEKLIRQLLNKRHVEFREAKGEAAFYGPKIDIQMKDMRGKENTAFTVQYDFCLPDRFDLTYIDAQGEKQRTLVVHRSSIGAIERVIAFLIEHYKGAFPLWLAPIQVKVLPISEKHVTYAESIIAELMKANIRAELDQSDESLGKKVRNAKVEKIPYFVVVGDQEVSARTLGVEHRTAGKVGTLSITDFVAQLHQEIAAKK
jgi:threonyl-tRNA synthetase